MAREIKFKCWDVERKMMYNIAFPSWNGMIEVWEDNKPQTKVLFLSQGGPEEQGILREYTGLKDKNGKEVLEGDLVRIPDCLETETLVEQVEYSDMWLGFEPFVPSCATCNFVPKEKQIEVIGNVWENPGLLEK